MCCIGCERTKTAGESTEAAAEAEQAEDAKEVVLAVAQMEPTEGSTGLPPTENRHAVEERSTTWEPPSHTS